MFWLILLCVPGWLVCIPFTMAPKSLPRSSMMPSISDMPKPLLIFLLTVLAVINSSLCIACSLGSLALAHHNELHDELADLASHGCFHSQCSLWQTPHSPMSWMPCCDSYTSCTFCLFSLPLPCTHWWRWSSYPWSLVPWYHWLYFDCLHYDMDAKTYQSKDPLKVFVLKCKSQKKEIHSEGLLSSVAILWTHHIF